jgi:hypothetical protein
MKHPAIHHTGIAGEVMVCPVCDHLGKCRAELERAGGEWTVIPCRTHVRDASAHRNKADSARQPKQHRQRLAQWRMKKEAAVSSPGYQYPLFLT